MDFNIQIIVSDVVTVLFVYLGFGAMKGCIYLRKGV